jgi:hypothetical protein
MPEAAAIWTKQTATILNGATVSDAIDAGPYTIFGIQLPAAFTGTALTFQVSADNITYQLLYDTANALVTIAAVAQGRSYILPSGLGPWPFFKVVSGTAEGAQRSIVIVKN